MAHSAPRTSFVDLINLKDKTENSFFHIQTKINICVVEYIKIMQGGKNIKKYTTIIVSVI